MYPTIHPTIYLNIHTPLHQLVHEPECVCSCPVLSSVGLVSDYLHSIEPWGIFVHLTSQNTHTNTTLYMTSRVWYTHRCFHVTSFSYKPVLFQTKPLMQMYEYLIKSSNSLCRSFLQKNCVIQTRIRSEKKKRSCPECVCVNLQIMRLINVNLRLYD